MASLCCCLSKRGHRVQLVTLDDGQRDRHRLDQQVQRQRLDVMSNTRGVWAKIRATRRRISRLRQAIRESDPDVVLSFCDRTNVLTLMATRGMGLPVVVSERSDPSQQRLGIAWEWLRDRTYRRATTILALTEEAADHLCSRLKVSVEVIPSAVNKPPVVSDRTLSASAKRMVAVGRLEREKGFDRLLEAMAKLPPSCNDWDLIILGEGSNRDALERQIETLGLSGRVRMPGWIEPIWGELTLATFFVLPSRYEGFPSALLEAMAIGIPCVAVDCESGPRAVIRDPSWAMLVPNQIDPLRDAMQHMIEHAEHREAMGKAGMQVIQSFDWDAMVDRYENVLTDSVRRTQSANRQ